MTALRQELAELIASEGPISLARYMALALSHPRHGYYRSRQPFGARGDFITAPDISQMFGELTGLWAADCWANMGRPERVAFIELGPGRGTLMADALRAAAVMPGFLDASSIHLVEMSKPLRVLQGEALARVGHVGDASACAGARKDEDHRAAPRTKSENRHDVRAKVPIAWHERFAEIPEGPLILIANEFFDALPIRQYMRGSEGWRERLIGLDDQGALAFGLSANIEPALRLAAPEGAVLEVCPDALALMRDIAVRLVAHGGTALLIDYGHARQGFGDTLQAMRRHKFVDPLAAPGEADLTAHVDFAALGQAARKAGAGVHGPVKQGDLLRALGIEARARRLKERASVPQAAAIDAALTRLTGEAAGEMGALFKAMAISNPPMPSLAGFGAPSR
jgi:NADH dehydrogenase [ubiquinone] 1 alpha subcomplex assembly factor 7